MARGPIWTEEDITYLEENSATKSYEEIADHLGKTLSSVRSKACRLGVQGRKTGELHYKVQKPAKAIKRIGRKAKAPKEKSRRRRRAG